MKKKLGLVLTSLFMIVGMTSLNVKANVNQEESLGEENLLLDTKEDDSATVLVNYVHVDGRVLSEPVIVKGRVDKVYLTQKLYFNGLQVKEVIGGSTGMFTKEQTVVTYVYEDKPGITESVVYAFYRNRNGDSLRDPIIKTHKPGDVYTTSFIEIEGYVLDKIIGEETGICKEYRHNVSYVYIKADEVSKDSSVIIKYIDSNGNAIQEDEVINGSVGSTYNLETKEISNYTLLKVDGNESGVFSSEDTVVRYIYTKNDMNESVVEKNEVSTNTDVNGSIEQKSDTSVHAQSDELKESPKTSNTTNTPNTPNTGVSEMNYAPLLVAGAIIAIISLVKTKKFSDN